MKKVFYSSVIVVLTLSIAFYANVAGAQTSGASGESPSHGDDVTGAFSDDYRAEAEQNQQLKRMAAEARRLEKEKAAYDVERLVDSTGLSCEIADADIIGHGTMLVSGKTTATEIFEVACASGVGYVIESQATNEPRIVSCFAATASVSFSQNIKNAERAFSCRLNVNKDVMAMASSLLKAHSKPCNLSNIRWLGISPSKQLEYTEVSCVEGAGYLLQVPRIHSSAAIAAISCSDAAKQGLRCRLSDGGAVTQPVTMQSYLDSLKQNGVDCEPVQLRLIGREVTKRRYVIEAQCFEKPKGIVAYLPLDGNTNKFELIDCDAAMQRSIRCKFMVN